MSWVGWAIIFLSKFYYTRCKLCLNEITVIDQIGNLLLGSSITAFEKSLLTIDLFPCSFDKVAVE